MPWRLSAYARALRSWNVDVVDTGEGRHPFKAVRDGKSFPFKAHNGMRSEISDAYINPLCRCFGIEAPEFRKKLSE